MRVIKDRLTPVYSLRKGRICLIKEHPGGIMLKRNKHSQILFQQPETNDIICLNEHDYESFSSPGRQERGPIYEDFNHYRHSLDDRYILWRNGDRDLDIYDCEDKKVNESISNFWTHEGINCQPISAISNREVSKILGLSQLDPNTQILQFYTKNQYNRTSVSTFRVKENFPTSNSL